MFRTELPEAGTVPGVNAAAVLVGKPANESITGELGAQLIGDGYGITHVGKNTGWNRL